MITLEVLRHAAIGGFQDFRAMYTWKTWTAGWLLRVVTQVIFYSLMGRLVGSEQQLHFLVIGNSVMLCATTVIFVVQSTTWERATGTLPLLIAAPVSPLLVLFGRSVQWIPDAVLSSMVAFLVAGRAFGVPLPLPRALWVLPLLLLVTVTTYLMGAFFGSLVLRYAGARNLVSNVAGATMMAVCGVNVPLSFFPRWVQVTARAMPLTHGLQAIRGILAAAPPKAVLGDVALESLVGLLWFAAAACSFRWFAEGGRKDGSIEFAA